VRSNSWKKGVFSINAWSLGRFGSFVVERFHGVGPVVLLGIKSVMVAALSFSLTGTLAVGGTTFAETPGTSPSLLQGWAEVASTGRLGVTTIFRSVTPGKISEGTVTGVSSGSRVILPFDNTQGLGTSIAVANTNPTQSLSISLVFQLDTGAQISGSLFLTAHAHTAFSLATMFPAVAGARGSILFSASSPDITVVGLRFNPAGSFTSLSSFQ
jgi:hypothetical protein